MLGKHMKASLHDCSLTQVWWGVTLVTSVFSQFRFKLSRFRTFLWFFHQKCSPGGLMVSQFCTARKLLVHCHTPVFHWHPPRAISSYFSYFCSNFCLHPSLWWRALRCQRFSLSAFLYFFQEEEKKASHYTLRPQTTGAPLRPLFLESHWPRTFPQVFVSSDFIRKRGLESTWGLGDMNKRIL